MLDGADVVYVERVQVDLARPSLDRKVGSRTGAYASALGHAILAWYDPEQARRVLASAERVRLSERTLVGLDELMQRLAAVRHRGYAISDGENAYGLRTLAAPVLDRDERPLAGVSLSVRSERIELDAFVADALPPLLRTDRGAHPRRPPDERGMTGLRLLADDLTGALDTAAELVGVTGPVHAFWHGAIPSELPANAAVDSGTRELDAAAAVAVVARLAPVLAGAELAYKKVDTLLRGPTLAEVAACARAGWEACGLRASLPVPGPCDARWRAIREECGGALVGCRRRHRRGARGIRRPRAVGPAGCAVAARRQRI